MLHKSWAELVEHLVDMGYHISWFYIVASFVKFTNGEIMDLKIAKIVILSITLITYSAKHVSISVGKSHFNVVDTLYRTKV